MQLFPEDLAVESFETGPTPTDPATEPIPWTQDPKYHSLCYICWHTDRTMCLRTCDDSCLVCIV